MCNFALERIFRGHDILLYELKRKIKIEHNEFYALPKKLNEENIDCSKILPMNCSAVGFPSSQTCE